MSVLGLIGYAVLCLLALGVIFGYSCDAYRWLQRRRESAGMREREAADQLYGHPHLIWAAPQHPPVNETRPHTVATGGRAQHEREFEGATDSRA